MSMWYSVTVPTLEFDYLYSAYKFKSVTKRFGRQINEFSEIV